MEINSKAKLQLSSKFLGRDDEIETIIEKYRSVRDGTTTTTTHSASPSIYIKGLSGVGKSALVETAFAGKDNVLYCSGKYDENQQGIKPFSALADALNSLCSKVLRRDNTKFATTQTQQLAELMKEDQGLLMSFLPNVSKFLQLTCDGDLSSVGSPRKATQHDFFRLKLSVTKLIQTLVGEETLVLFIDDLQWANADDLELMDEIISTVSPTRMLFVGGFRSNEVNEEHALTNYLSGFNTSQTVIDIHELTLDDLNEYVADTLKYENVEECMGLSELVLEKTNGNIFYVRQFIDCLYKNGQIYFGLNELKWEWEDVACIQDKYDAQSGMQDVLAKNLRRLPSATMEAVKLAACIGGRFEMSVLDVLMKSWKSQRKREHHVSDEEPIEETLWPAVEEGLLEEIASDPFCTELTYKFAHDKVLEAAYDSTLARRMEYHQTVGKCLQELYDGPDGRSWMLILAAEHMYKVKCTLKHQPERDAVAKLNYDAAKVLKSHSAFVSAVGCLRNAMDLLGVDAWTRSYEFAFKTYDLAAEIEFYAGNHSRCEAVVNEILRHAKTVHETERAQIVYMESLSASMRHKDSYRIGLKVLRNMHISHIPRTILTPHMRVEVARTLHLLKKKPTNDLLNWNRTEDKRIETYIRLLMMSSMFAWFTHNKNGMGFLTLRALRISLKYGYAGYTAPAFTWAAMICGALEEFTECDRLGDIGIRVRERFDDCREADSLTRFLYLACSRHVFHVTDRHYWKSYAEARADGIKFGGLTFGCAAASCRALFSICDGSVKVDKVLVLATQCRDEQIALNQLNFLQSSRVTRQLAINLGGRNNFPLILEGGEYSDVREISEDPDPLSQRFYNWASMYLGYMFGDLKQAGYHGMKHRKVWKHDYPAYGPMFYNVHRQLTWCGLFNETGLLRYKRLARHDLRMFKGWVDKGCVNHKSTHAMLLAETMAFVDRAPVEATRLQYDKAVELLEDAGFYLLSACCLERAGTYFSAHDDFEDLSNVYLLKSMARYCDMRAHAKAKDLKQKHPHLSLTDVACSSTAGDISLVSE